MSEKHFCSKDGKEYPSSNFYKAPENTIYGEIGYIPVCKSCISKLSKNYYNAYQDIMLSVFLICIKIDLGFDKELYESVVTDKLGVERATKTYLDAYTKQNNPKFTNADDMGYALGLFDVIYDYLKASDLEDKEEIEMEWVTYKVTENDISFWGKDYSQEEYYLLTKTFDDYLDSFTVETPSARELLKQICLTTLEIRNLRDIQRSAESQEQKLVHNKTIDELTTRLLKILNDNNMKPNQKKNVSDSQESFGTLIEKWEFEDPVPDPFSEWERNNIYKDVGIWIVGHIRKMLGKEKIEEYEEELEKYTVERVDD